MSNLNSKKKIAIHAKSCLRYGDMPANARGVQAQSLIPRHFYTVFLNGRPNDPSDPTYGYEGKFCIATGASGEQQVMSIDSDSDSDSQAWIDEIYPAGSLSE